MKKTYKGSCHCGTVRFECDLDLAEGTTRCNCAICTKGRFWKAIVKAGGFRLLQGEQALSDYQFASHSIHHLFCERCGIKPFAKGFAEALGGEFYAANVACLDDVADKELAQAPVRYEDGRHNQWQKTPEETRYL